MKTRLMFVALSASVLFACVGRGCGPALHLVRRKLDQHRLARLAQCVRAAAFCLVTCIIAAGCGGSSSAKEEPDAPTLEDLLARSR